MNASLAGVGLNGPYELQVTLKTDLCITKSCTNKTIQLFFLSMACMPYAVYGFRVMILTATTLGKRSSSFKNDCK